MSKLRGKVALVTGAARGIGAAIARSFAEHGAAVYVTDIDDRTGTELARSIGQPYCHLDVREEAEWERVMGLVRAEHGGLDVLVNNAGVTAAAPSSTYRRVRASWAFRARPRTRRRRRRFATIRRPWTLYCAEEGLNIRCNSIHPAAIHTPMWKPLLGTGSDRGERMRELVRDTPLRRFGTPEEVAAVALLLASDEAAYMTGAEINIDGGILAGSAGAPARD